MSRAFVKELEDAPDLRVEGNLGEPRPITPRGYADLTARFEAEGDPHRKAVLGRLLDSVVATGPPAKRDKVALGARVVVRGAAEDERTFEIVGEDEIDPARGRIGASSPLAIALLGKKAGASAVWERPAGNKRLTIVSLSYE